MPGPTQTLTLEFSFVAGGREDRISRDSLMSDHLEFGSLRP